MSSNAPLSDDQATGDIWVMQRDELLEALETLVEGYVALYAGETFAMAAEGDECMKKARAVIAKVKGEM